MVVVSGSLSAVLVLTLALGAVSMRGQALGRTRKYGAWLLATLLLGLGWWSVTAQELTLPSAPNSVKFAAIGDAGTGDPAQYDIANQMARFHAKFPFDRVIMLGDNIYGGQGPQDLVKKFSQPYKALLDSGVKFYASLGNHDDPANRRYPLWNMGGQIVLQPTRRRTSGSSRSTATRSIRRSWPGSRTP